MEADFEGTMQDMPKEDKDDMDEEEDEEGDADRIDQQMGDAGENEEVGGWVGGCMHTCVIKQGKFCKIK
jgi:hypothetical protein